MFRSIVILAVAALASQTLYAAPASTAAVRNVRSNEANIEFSGGLVNSNGSYGGSFLAGVNLAVEHNSPVRLGFDSGVIFGHGVGLPILLSLMYNFTTSGSVTPYVAGAVGPIIGVSSGGGYGFGGVTSSYIGDGVKLGIFVRPGLRFNLTELLDLTTEVAVGGVTGYFYIAPTLGIQLRV